LKAERSAFDFFFGITRNSLHPLGRVVRHSGGQKAFPVGKWQCRKHPNQADFNMSLMIANFAAKNAMFNLNENNRIVMSQHPTDMRMGINCLCGQVRLVGLEPTNGDVYIFVSKSRKVMKILHWEYGGYVMYQKRLEKGRFHPRIFLRQGVGFRSMRWSELVLLMEGISPKVARRRRYEPVMDAQEKIAQKDKIIHQKSWLSR